MRVLSLIHRLPVCAVSLLVLRVQNTVMGMNQIALLPPGDTSKSAGIYQNTAACADR